MTPLFVGLNPSHHPGVDWNDNPSFARLFRWVEELEIRFFSFVNVQHSQGKYAPTTMDRAFLASTVKNHQGPIIALGNEVANALRQYNVNFFKMPHPSPLNRLLNDEEYEAEMLNQLREFIRVEQERIRIVQESKKKMTEGLKQNQIAAE